MVIGGNRGGNRGGSRGGSGGGSRGGSRDSRGGGIIWGSNRGCSKGNRGVVGIIGVVKMVLGVW